MLTDVYTGLQTCTGQRTNGAGCWRRGSTARHRMALKHGGLRRALLGLVLFGVGLCFYLYWAQVGGDLGTITPRLRNARQGKRYAETLWTWVCISNRCERREKSKEAATSLETCNMLCGSTQLWPQPTGPVQLGSHFVTFFLHQLRFETIVQEPELDLLERAYDIFKTNIKLLLDEPDDPWSYKSDINEFIVKIIITLHNQTRLQLNTDEGYNLTVRLSGNDLIATVRAKTFFGARHGLETLSQLIWADQTETGATVLRTLKGASVQDAPKFAYRGLMLDTSRHFFSVEALKKMIRGMSSSKLNVFHWHISDSQSFPFDSPRVPQMAKYGALSPDMTYTAHNIKDIVDFAKIRGVRVLIEVDTPAHAGNGWNWGPLEGLGELAVCVNQQPWNMYCGEPPCGQLNPDNPNIYKVIENLYADILDLTQEREMFHLGGDEVNLNCWEQRQTKISTPYNYTDLHETWGEFTVQAMKRLELANKGRIIPNIIMWSSDLTKRPYIDKYLSKHKIIVQTWGGSTWPETTDLLDDGYRIIISHVDAWYLDCGFGKWRETGGAACDPYRTWQTVYTHRPWQRMRLDPAKRSLVLGGEACLWTEQVDEVSLDTRLWPRAAAFAERLWSDPAVDLETLSIHEDVYTRLSTHRERLMKRRLKAEAMWPKWCAQNPGMCL